MLQWINVQLEKCRKCRKYCGVPVDRPRSRLSVELCRGERRSIGDRLRSTERDRRLGGESITARRSFFRRSFSFMICSNAARGSSMIPVPILFATPWNADATIFDSGIFRIKMEYFISFCIHIAIEESFESFPPQTHTRMHHRSMVHLWRWLMLHRCISSVRHLRKRLMRHGSILSVVHLAHLLMRMHVYRAKKWRKKAKKRPNL